MSFFGYPLDKYLAQHLRPDGQKDYGNGVLTLSPERLARYQAIDDLTNAIHGHAINLALEKIKNALEAWSGLTPTLPITPSIVPETDNFDKLYYPVDAIARDPRYTHRVSETHILRTHTTAAVPPELAKIKGDTLLVVPGLVYRRDVIDRTHVGEPHQVDLWLVKKARLGRSDLVEMIGVVLGAVMPGCDYRMNETSHPYTKDGLEVEVLLNGKWVEVLECGEALPRLLDDSGHSSEEWAGLAMGIGLDRLVMLIKGVTDIRLLRSNDPRVARQMANLLPYSEVSCQPATTRDMSVVLYDPDMEVIGDRVREALGDDDRWVEDIELISKHSSNEVPHRARERLGMRPDQSNVLLRLHLRDATTSIPRDVANNVYRRVYSALHEGYTQGYV